MISETNLGKIDGFKENHQKLIKPPSNELTKYIWADD